jgi:hypothetical protein
VTQDLTFFEVSAQVIPTLLIVLVFQVRVLPVPPLTEVRTSIYVLVWLAGMGYLVLLARAEWTALRVLRDGAPTTGAKAELTSALIFELWMLVLAAIFTSLYERAIAKSKAEASS